SEYEAALQQVVSARLLNGDEHGGNLASADQSSPRTLSHGSSIRSYTGGGDAIDSSRGGDVARGVRGCAGGAGRCREGRNGNRGSAQQGGQSPDVAFTGR